MHILTYKVKLLIRPLLLTLFILGLVYFLGYINTQSQRQKFCRRLATEVERKRSSDNVIDVRLKDLTDFTWDRVHIFNPYTPSERIDKDLGYVWQSAGHTSIYTHDAIVLLVFTNQGKVVFYVDLPRYPGDFKGNYKKGGYSLDEAIFNVEEGAKQDNGLPWLHLIWKWRNEPI